MGQTNNRFHGMFVPKGGGREGNLERPLANVWRCDLHTKRRGMHASSSQWLSPLGGMYACEEQVWICMLLAQGKGWLSCCQCKDVCGTVGALNDGVRCCPFLSQFRCSSWQTIAEGRWQVVWMPSTNRHRNLTDPQKRISLSYFQLPDS